MSDTIIYTVPAIHCEHCAMSIREEVTEVPGVERSTSISTRRS